TMAPGGRRAEITAALRPRKRPDYNRSVPGHRVSGLARYFTNWSPCIVSVFLGIDIGTSGTKTLAIDEQGNILAEATAGYPVYHPKPLWSEQDPEGWWKATVKTVRAVVKAAKLKPADVKAIVLSGQLHGSVFLDKNHNVVRKA